MDFIIENYIIIIFVGLFFVFALIGYLIDMLRRPKEEIKEELDIKPIEIKDIELPKEGIKEIIESNNSNNKLNDKSNADDLLKNYDESITE